MDRQQIKKMAMQYSMEKKDGIVVSIPEGMTGVDAMILLGNLRVRLWLLDTPVKITIHEGKYMVFALAKKLKEEKYMKEFLQMSLEECNTIESVSAIR